MAQRDEPVETLEQTMELLRQLSALYDQVIALQGDCRDRLARDGMEGQAEELAKSLRSLERTAALLRDILEELREKLQEMQTWLAGTPDGLSNSENQEDNWDLFPVLPISAEPTDDGERRRCTHCGSELGTALSFCPVCGARQSAWNGGREEPPGYGTAPAYSAPSYDTAPAYSEAPAYGEAPAYSAAPAMASRPKRRSIFSLFQRRAREGDDGPGTIEMPGTGGGAVHSAPARDGFCPRCGAPRTAGVRFCRRCGVALIEDEKASSVSLSQVEFSAVAPKVFSRDRFSMVEVVMYEPDQRQVVDALLAQADEPVRETRGGQAAVAPGAEVRVILTSEDLPDFRAQDARRWQGGYLDFQFPVRISQDFRGEQLRFQATVYFDGVIATRLRFLADCGGGRRQPLTVLRQDIHSAFVSYASQDRTAVALLIQGMQKVRPELDIFFDVASLRSGDEWEPSLREEIQRRDMLFLCWSRHARESRWVDAEWRYALAHKGINAIDPLPIEPPELCPPPEELRRKHFNDRMLYFTRAAD